MKRWGALAAALLLTVALAAPVAAVKPDKGERNADGKPGWGPPPWSPNGTPSGQFNPNNPGGTHHIPEPEPKPDPEPDPDPEPPIVGPDGLPPVLPDTAMGG